MAVGAKLLCGNAKIARETRIGEYINRLIKLMKVLFRIDGN